MSNDFGIKFNDNLLMNDLIEHMVKRVEIVSRSLLAHFKSNTDGQGIVEGKSVSISSDWFERVKYDKMEEAIIGVVGNNHWYAFIDNYGSGSRMDMSRNPFLEEYMQSGFYNKERAGSGNAVLTRGSYKTPDYVSGYGTKTVNRRQFLTKDGEPVNLEKHINKKTGEPYFVPQDPKYWFDDGMAWIEQYFYDEMLDSLDDFNFDSNKYLQGRG